MPEPLKKTPMPARKDRRSVAGRASAPMEPGQELSSPSHDQWLLDEALAETFPASDPISPSTTKDKAGQG